MRRLFLLFLCTEVFTAFLQNQKGDSILRVEPFVSSDW